MCLSEQVRCSQRGWCSQVIPLWERPQSISAESTSMNAHVAGKSILAAPSAGALRGAEVKLRSFFELIPQGFWGERRPV